jgi:hypothetical protein
MRLGCEGESATQPQFFVDTKELMIARLGGMVFKPVSGFHQATRMIHEIALSCMTKSISGCVSWIVLSPKSKDY